ncbi:MAG: hypothetical protein MZW92_63745 [Comamonadaceae bacterium]|nr:hypothetical protein [Comamonadaceae bacterium]
MRLRVTERAEFCDRDRQLKPAGANRRGGIGAGRARSFDESAPPIWEQLARHRLEAPAGTWDAVPDDLSTRIDEVVYGHARTGGEDRSSPIQATGRPCST